MKAMILDGSGKDDVAMSATRNIIEDSFGRAGHDISVFTLRDLDVATCCGFFRCWLKTPGICVINDIAQDIVKCAVLSDYWVFLTAITFGGYSAELKKAIDRMPPLLLPYFTKINGEVHHKMRYEKHPHLLVFGSAQSHNADMEDIFKELVQRNSINFHSKSAISSIVLSNDTFMTVTDKVKEALSGVSIKA